MDTEAVCKMKINVKMRARKGEAEEEKEEEREVDPVCRYHAELPASPAINNRLQAGRI